MVLLFLIKALLAWLLLSQIILLLWSVRPESLYRKFDWGLGTRIQRIVSAFVVISASVGLVFVLIEGIKSFLIFLPEKWDAYRVEIAIWIALPAAIIFIYSLLKNDEIRRKEIDKKQEGWKSIIEEIKRSQG